MTHTQTMTQTKPSCTTYYTTEQVEQCNGGNNPSYTILYGKVYDMSELFDIHPGGTIIKYAAGRDCTSLFESYHSTQSLNKCHMYVNKYLRYIGQHAEQACKCVPVEQYNPSNTIDSDINDSKGYIAPNNSNNKDLIDYKTKSHNTCVHQADDSFFVTVRQRVDNELIKLYGSSGRHAREWIGKLEATITLLAYCITTYYTSFYGSYTAAILLGFVTGRMGFVMHSGNHCAISSSSIWNRCVGMFMDIVGSSHYIWGYEHQVAHHMTPNEYKKDNDCEIGNPFFRFHPLIKNDNIDNDSAQPTESSLTPIDRFARRNQHWLVPCLMSIGFFKWFCNDVEFFINQRAGNVKIPTTIPLWSYMIVCKIVWCFVHVYIPYQYFGLSTTLITVCIFMSIGAEYLENTFIVNHIQEQCQLPMIDLEHQKQLAGNKPLHWAVQQVCTTTNWASESIFWNYMSGGLNHQIEHHLFPTMSICLYPVIAPIVKQTCMDYGLPYNNYNTFMDAYSDMLYYLKKLGQDTDQLHHKQKSH